ncbi:MAG: alanine--tRNA ligase [Parcubacteria group bacterium]|nr:alanine--tRNA ligase [Parcubacteria group bacterium]
MTHTEIRKKFLDFFEKKGHTIVPSSSLLPDDPSVLFTTAGMQQFKPYYTGEADPMKDFGSLNTVSIQKSMRTSDIDEIGDESHLTFFEMLGNFSFGLKPNGSAKGGPSTLFKTSYFKKEAIEYAHKFITNEMGLTISHVSVFKGSSSTHSTKPQGGEPVESTSSGQATVPKDEESKKIWQSLGVSDIREEGMEDVFWGPTGNSGPCGPTTEIYCKNTQGQDVEIWNIVFNEFFCNGSREQLLSNKTKLTPLEKNGIDTGMGLERLVMIAQNTKSIFETALFSPILNLIPIEDTRIKRIITDHSRAIAFLITDGVRPSNKEQGYILRRLMRRVITYGQIHKMDLTIMHDIFAKIHEIYSPIYHDLDRNLIIHEFDNEKEKFEKTLKSGLKELAKIPVFDASGTFKIYESFGLPYEIIKELGGEKAKNLNREDFDKEFKKHQELSRAGIEKKFGGHGLLLDTGELKAADEQELKTVTKLHTATHMLQAALRKVLDGEVKQAGSDITAERLRFDFTFPRKMTNEEIKQVEDLINEAIKKDLPVTFKEMPLEEAQKSGALFFSKQKYPPVVKVYTVGPDPSTSSGPPFSRELCGGPHVTHTGEIGQFKIIREEAVSSGIRRVRAILKE